MAIITISRGSTSGGEALSEHLKEKLGYPLVGREILVTAAEKLGISEDALMRKIAQGPGFWERLTANRRLYVAAVQASLAEHALCGKLLYSGHVGHLLLRGIQGILRIRVLDSVEHRVASVMRKQRLGRGAALEYIRSVDEERVHWARFIYGVDWTDASLYDLVVNLEQMGVDTTCEMVATIAARPEFTFTEKTEKALVDLYLAARVKIALASNPLTSALDLEVTSSNGELDIRAAAGQNGDGPLLHDRDEAAVVRAAEGVEGVKSVSMKVCRC